MININKTLVFVNILKNIYMRVVGILRYFTMSVYDI